MKKTEIRESLLMLLVMFVCSLLGTDVSMAVGVPLGQTGAGNVTAEGVAGVADMGVHLDEGMSVQQARLESEDILATSLDRIVTKILPYKTPLDQIFRYAQQRPVTAKSMVVEWVSVDTKPFTTTVATTSTATTTAHDAALVVTDASPFAVTSTIIVPQVTGYEADGTTASTDPLMLYVKAKSGSTLTVMAVNGPKCTGSNGNFKYVPVITSGYTLLRQGRAAYEKDIQTEVSTSYPTKESNYMQAFKCQVEESFWYKNSDKVIDWSMQDQKEMAILEWKMEIEASYLNGVKGVIYDETSGKGEVYTCNGILRYIKKSYEYPADGWTKEDFVDMTKAAFTGNAGSPKRVLLMGSGLMSSIMKVDLTMNQDMQRGSEIIWDIEFDTIKTNFGTILCKHFELLDNNGMTDNGVLIDPNQLFKYVFESENSLVIDNRKTGTSNTEADVTTEVSCPGIKYPQAHLLIKKKSA